MQVALFQWARLQECVRPALGLLHAIPNGGARPAIVGKDGRRFSVSAARMKAEGVKAGVPDVCLPVGRLVAGDWWLVTGGKAAPAAGGMNQRPAASGQRPASFTALYLELKAGKNHCSTEQWRWIYGLREAGAAAVVVRDEWTRARDLIWAFLDERSAEFERLYAHAMEGEG